MLDVSGRPVRPHMEPQIVDSIGVFQFRCPQTSRWRNRFFITWNGCPALALGKMSVDPLERRARQIMLEQPAPLAQPSGSGPVWTRHLALTPAAHPRPSWSPASQPNGVLPRPPNSRTLPQADLRNHTMCRATSTRARFGLAAIADRAVGVLLVAVVAACATPDSEPTVAAFPPVAVEAPLDLPVAKPPAPLAPRPVLPFDAASQLPGTVQMPQALVADASESDPAPSRAEVSRTGQADDGRRRRVT